MSGRGARASRRERRAELPQNIERNRQPSQSQKPTLNITHFHPKSKGQHLLKAALQNNILVIASGPAGTGKTLLCVDRAADLFLSQQVKRIVFARPAVEAGEKIGTLPGGINEKLDPFMRPLFDELSDKLGGDYLAASTVAKWLETKQVEIVPIGQMRGRTLKHAAIVIDEAQNATREQITMALTRLGEGSYMFVTGDPKQSDIGAASGFAGITDTLEANGYPVVRLDRSDIHRHPIVADLLRFL
jgi:phosphate starvation-inducible PhoH-like protein